METKRGSTDVPVERGRKHERSLPSVLMVGNQADFVDYMRSLDNWGSFYFDEVRDEVEAISKVEEGEYSLVIVCGKGIGGYDKLLKTIKKLKPSTPCFHLCRLEDNKRNSYESRVGGYAGGANCVFFDSTERTEYDWNRTGSNRCSAVKPKLAEESIKRTGLSGLVGISSVMQQVYERIERASQVSSVVLLQGESGTGKELAARAIHFVGKRKENPFIPVNCSAIPDNLLESELFGYVRGAFSGAVANTQGILRAARGGTVFFDEIGELSLRLQAKLLRFVEDKIVKPLGSNRTYKIDVRIIVATNTDLREEINKGRFRRDLFYRINILPIYMPPLRAKKEDIPLLVDHFLEKYGRSDGRIVRGVSSEVLSAFFQYAWPGNVREMENVIQQAIVMGSGPILTMKNFPGRLSGKNAGCLLEENVWIPTLREVEKELITKALRETNGNISGAAKLLGVDRKTIYRKVKRFSISA